MNPLLRSSFSNSSKHITVLISSPAPPIFAEVLKIKLFRASLVAQWLRICLPMQATRVRALVWGDPTCRGAAGPVSHNY